MKWVLQSLICCCRLDDWWRTMRNTDSPSLLNRFVNIFSITLWLRHPSSIDSLKCCVVLYFVSMMCIFTHLWRSSLRLRCTGRHCRSRVPVAATVWTRQCSSTSWLQTMGWCLFVNQFDVFYVIAPKGAKAVVRQYGWQHRWWRKTKGCAL